MKVRRKRHWNETVPWIQLQRDRCALFLGENPVALEICEIHISLLGREMLVHHLQLGVWSSCATITLLSADICESSADGSVQLFGCCLLYNNISYPFRFDIREKSELFIL